MNKWTGGAPSLSAPAVVGACECDVDFRCLNHDMGAEAADWFREWVQERRTDSGGYDWGDPKNPEYMDQVFDAGEDRP